MQSLWPRQLPTPVTPIDFLPLVGTEASGAWGEGGTTSSNGEGLTKNKTDGGTNPCKGFVSEEAEPGQIQERE